LVRFDNENALEEAVRLIDEVLHPPSSPSSSPSYFIFEGKGEDLIQKSDMGKKAFAVLLERFHSLRIGLQVVHEDLMQKSTQEDVILRDLLKRQEAELTEDLGRLKSEIIDFTGGQHDIAGQSSGTLPPDDVPVPQPSLTTDQESPDVAQTPHPQQPLSSVPTEPTTPERIKSCRHLCKKVRKWWYPCHQPHNHD
jgi:hypothetical protein